MKAFARAFRNHTTSFIFPNVQFVCLCRRADERGCLARGKGKGTGGEWEGEGEYSQAEESSSSLSSEWVCVCVSVLATFKVNFHCEATQAIRMVAHTSHHISYNTYQYIAYIHTT